MSEPSIPHGGQLVNRFPLLDERKALIEESRSFKKIHLTPREISDLEMVAIGGFSPLNGFMGKEDYENVLNNMRLKNGLPWTIPITLAVTEEEAKPLKIGERIALVDPSQKIFATLHLIEKFRYDKEREAELVYKTKDIAHPGVKVLYEQGDVLLAGEIIMLERPRHEEIKNHWLDPSDTRKIFSERGWKRIAGFQTRNPIHRAHEYIQKCAMEIVDGLFIHPIVGETKSDDVPALIRMRCYEVLIENYYPKKRVLLAVNPSAMRYAGPREAIFHAIVRKNYGCTHFIVGRDHAGVGNYYGSFDAHYIFEEFKDNELGITPLFFDHTFYCKHCASMASNKTCPHDKSEHLIFSGTRVREMLRKGEIPPQEFTRPEIAKILIEELHGKR